MDEIRQLLQSPRISRGTYRIVLARMAPERIHLEGFHFLFEEAFSLEEGWRTDLTTLDAAMR